MDRPRGKRTKRRESQAQRDAAYRRMLGIPEDAPPPSFRTDVQKPRRVPLASPVVITRADGSIETVPPLTPRELRMLVKDREPIAPSLRAKVLRRDRGLCRYCGSSGPFHIDHVLPVALGGRSTYQNLVLACVECNLRKGANVWRPKPVGHFLRRGSG